MVGILVSFWEGLFSGAMCYVRFRECNWRRVPSRSKPQERILDHGSMESCSFPKTGDHCVEQMYIPILDNTADGRNPAPPGMYKTLKIMGHLPYQLVHDFFHQQYVNIFQIIVVKWRYIPYTKFESFIKHI